MIKMQYAIGKKMGINYYLKLRIPGINNNWMRSEALSLDDAYNGWLTLRDYQFTGEDIEITQRKGRHIRRISFNELSRLVNGTRQGQQKI